MPCPDELALQRALNDDGPESGTSGTQVDVWNHVEHCPQCQSKLARFIEDTELCRWRDSALVRFKSRLFSAEAEREAPATTAAGSPSYNCGWKPQLRVQHPVDVDRSLTPIMLP
jgi:hypothetical protein